MGIFVFLGAFDHLIVKLGRLNFFFCKTGLSRHRGG